MSHNSYFTKSKQIELAQSLTDAQKHHIVEATKLGYKEQEIKNKLNLTIGQVCAYLNCLEQGWL